MYTPLKRTPLRDLCEKPIMFDANIFMVGIGERYSNSNCSFENMKNIYLIPLFENFQHIIIHEMVYNELDKDAKALVDSYSNVEIVSEGNLYGVDPQYTTIFQNIASHERVNYDRRSSKDRGEVYSLAYAAFYNINLFCCKEIMVDDVARDLEDLKEIDVITYDVIVLLAYLHHNKKGDKEYNKALKSIYKRFCEDVIKRHKLPPKLSEYVIASQDYL